jgi:hypothetical protein
MPKNYSLASSPLQRVQGAADGLPPVMPDVKLFKKAFFKANVIIDIITHDYKIYPKTGQSTLLREFNMQPGKAGDGATTHLIVDVKFIKITQDKFCVNCTRIFLRFMT